MPVFLSPPAQRHFSQLVGYRVPLEDGEAGTAQTIEVMRELVDDALNDQSFIRTVSDIVRPAQQFDELSEIHAIYDWFKQNIRFTRDPVTKEKLYPPAELLKIRSGDCDDYATAIAAALMSVGVNARFVTAATNAESPGEFTHVWTEAETPAGSGNWIPVDPARFDSQFGLEPEHYFRKRAWNITDDSYEDLSGNRHRMPKFLSGYLSMVRKPPDYIYGPGGQLVPRPPVTWGHRQLGQDGTDINWTPILQQSVAEIPAITAAVSGKGTATSPYATYSSPYASFATPYTPGYGVPATGYSTTTYPTATAGLAMSPTTLMLIAGAVLIFMMARK